MAGPPDSVIAEQVFVPTHMSTYQGEVVGDPLLEFTCKALLYGQCLMSVGGYIVRGTISACKRRAKATRTANGAFERVEPKYLLAVPYEVSMTQRMASPRQQQQPLLPLCDDSAAASAILLAIQGTLSSTVSDRKSNVLLPELEAQAAVEKNEAIVEKTEDNVEKSELAFHDRVQLFEPHTTRQQQQFEQDTHIQTLASIQAGKQPLPPTNNDQEVISTILIILDRIAVLERRLDKQTTTTNDNVEKIPFQAQISNPITNGATKLSQVDELHGPNDPYRNSCQYDSLADRIRSWALEVINIQNWPKAQMIGGRITDVTNMVQKEVERIIKDNNNGKNITNGQQQLMDVMRTQTSIEKRSEAMQVSPISVSSGGSNGTSNNSVNNAIIANLGVGGNGGDDGDGDGGGVSADIGNINDRDGKGGGSKRFEFTLINQRNITINVFIGRNFHTNPYMPFNNAVRRLILSQGHDGELLLKYWIQLKPWVRPNILTKSCKS